MRKLLYRSGTVRCFGRKYALNFIKVTILLELYDKIKKINMETPVDSHEETGVFIVRGIVRGGNQCENRNCR